MSINPNEDTEFNDALRKHGIIPPREPTPSSPSPPPSPTLEEMLEDYTPSELKELSEDAPDDETERLIAAHRRQRIALERNAEKKARFGRVYPIGRDDYTREVTDASKIDEEDDDEEKGTGVVCFLYKDGIPRSERTFEHIRALATRYPRTKFVSIVGDKCIPNLPDSRIPMLIIYRKGEIRNQVIAWGSDRERRSEELEAILLMTGAVDLPDVPPTEQRRGDDDSDDDDSEDRRDPSARMRSAATSTNGRTQKNIRRSGDDGDDSDFEFDL
ncbi:thioredoxin-like protein [Desarmillaria tabescens]|uniref:Thioredoxin-like protein n=1 Tax=Armillaria tabescens TaxID=1929756 RepID=A0AA39KCY2_ARMTA|nr:thioredoxin-like protein [Desarmillaria tabescens]KAK0458513.1 thioredoxin-like protein [Desarmillaria tabescens]